MGIYFRKSLKLGALRLNLSKKGVGLSAGVRGLRVGTRAGSKGLYVRGGRKGIYFSKKIK